MTDLSTTTTNDTSSPSRASAATLAEHSDARWADWQRRDLERDDLRSRRTWIIGSIIGAGLVIWLLVSFAS
jgi:hypothetical protein